MLRRYKSNVVWERLETRWLLYIVVDYGDICTIWLNAVFVSNRFEKSCRRYMAWHGLASRARNLQDREHGQHSPAQHSGPPTLLRGVAAAAYQSPTKTNQSCTVRYTSQPTTHLPQPRHPSHIPLPSLALFQSRSNCSHPLSGASHIANSLTLIS